VSITDYPDTYQIAFVSPPQQTVAIAVTYNTSAVNFLVGQLSSNLVIQFSIINATPVKSINFISNRFSGICKCLSPALTRMVFAVSINGVGVAPWRGTGIIAGDVESYFANFRAGDYRAGIAVTSPVS
jgi:hypothetical protein